MRSASAADATVGSSLIWPYSLVVVPKDDRIIVTSFVMGGFPHSVRLPIGSWSESKINATNTKHVQYGRSQSSNCFLLSSSRPRPRAGMSKTLPSHEFSRMVRFTSTRLTAVSTICMG